MSSSNRYTFSSLHILSPTILSSNQRSNISHSDIPKGNLLQN